MRYRLVSGAIMAALVVAASLRAEEKPPARAIDAKKPTVVVRLASFDTLFADLRYVVELIGKEEEAKQLEALLKSMVGDKGLEGIDTTRPMAMYGKLTKGFTLSRHNLYRQSVVTLIRAGVYAFRDRRAKKRDFRRLWIARVSAACRMRGLRYSQFVVGLQRANVELDRKTLANIAVHDPDTFTKIVELARANQPPGSK